MNELTIKTPEEMTAEELGAEIRTMTGQVKGLILNFGIQIGYRLKLVQEKLSYGEKFPEWVEKNTEFSKSAAYRYIKLFDEYGGQTGLFGVENIFPTLGKLSISNALRLLEVPAEEREEFAEKVDAENISARELEKAIAEKKAAEEAAEAALREKQRIETDLKTARAERDRLSSENKELRERPVEIAVQEPSEEQIRAEAEKLTAEEKAKREQAEKELAASEKLRAEVANKAAGLEAEIEAMKKKLSEAEKAGNEEKAKELERLLEDTQAKLKKAALRQQIAGANTLFQQAQRLLQEAVTAARAVEDAGIRDKLLAAMAAGIDKVKEGLA